MTTLLDEVAERRPMSDHDGRSGALLEKVRLADGTSLIVKWLDRSKDLGMQVTDDFAGREHVLWQAGVLDRLPAGTGHAVVQTWPTPTGSALAMRDLSGSMLGWASRISREECQRILAAVTRMHETFAGATATPGACSLRTRISIMVPQTMRPFADSENPLPRLILHGWEVFAETAPRDIAEAVLPILSQPDLISGPLSRLPQTFVHGDVSLPNIALEEHQVTLLDWGLAANAPAAFEIAWFLADSGSLVDATLDEILSDYQQLAGSQPMDLSLLAAFVGLGWNKALNAATHPDPVARAEQLHDLHWWYDAIRPALSSL